MEFDVVIVGGGLVGASLAAALKDSGLNLALVEGQSAQFSHEGWDPRIYAITPGNVEFLKQCGSWQRQDMSRVQPVEAMRVFGDDNSELEFSAYEIGAPELTFILENRLMQEALWDTIRDQDNLTMFNPARCASLDLALNTATLRLDDGRELRAKLVVGADGRDSWVRKQAGMDEAPTPYQQHGVVANFRCEKPHRGVAYQWFRPDSILAYLPLPQQQMSMVWSVLPEKSAELLELSSDELCAQVAAAGHHTLGELELVTPPASFALRILRLPHIVKPRLALVGDAAHNVHPLAGQGVNLGFRDARELAQVLLARGPQPDCGDHALLRRYDRARQEDIFSMLTTTDTLKKLFCNADPLLRKVRNLGLSATHQLTPAKRMLARHALI
ncbi:UbiH/UbiF family hydroxylase [Ferriphaselus sp. R-1]|uniref:UbiH/UbiF family hydroxylase n=1 Tax=Ferriphaselus sp. R-1 TaxID=1485544 RepID=UPI0005530DCF|nr:UbiH/UbiF family hydroxylase [Ferriphaselus sp. R-1]